MQFDKKPEAPPVRGGFVMTPTARNILRSLDLVASECGGAITLVAAAPGIGKTEALWSCKHARPDAIMFTAVDGEGGPWGAACQLAQLLGLSEPKANNLMVDRQRIAEEIGADGLLLVDEAQYLARRNPKGADDGRPSTGCAPCPKKAASPSPSSAICRSWNWRTSGRVCGAVPGKVAASSSGTWSAAM